MKDRRIIIAFLKIMIVLCVLCGCQTSNTKETKIKNEKLSELKIDVNTLKPFFYVNENGSYKGIDAEIAYEACSRAGYKPNFIFVDWSDRDEYLQNQTVDCLWSVVLCQDFGQLKCKNYL